MRFCLFLFTVLILSASCSFGETVSDFDHDYDKRPFWAGKKETFFPCERSDDGIFRRVSSETAPLFCATGVYEATDGPNMREQLSLMTAEARAKEALNKGLAKAASGDSKDTVYPAFTATYWERTAGEKGKTVFTAYAIAAVSKDAHSNSKDPL